MECFKIQLFKTPFELCVCVCVCGLTAEKLVPNIEQEINSVRLKISGCQRL